jgi:phosphoribosylamine---glycine ligase
MITASGPKVIEFNARFGDPETQVVLPRLKTDLVEIMESVIDGKLSEQDIVWSDQAAVCVILASGGYPGSYQKGMAIQGLDKPAADTVIFHSGTVLSGEEWLTAGGRVLGVTAWGESIQEAQTRAYERVKQISFDNVHYRTDIAKKAL